MASLKNSAGNVFVETGLCCNFESHFFTSQNAMYFRTRLNYFVQLSQLEDPRWPRRDLPCPPEVRLQHLRRQWRQCSHPQVNKYMMFRISNTQVLSSEQGWSVQPWGEPATAEDQEECCWELLQPQVFKQVEFNSTCDVVKA